jgi:saccharopine dehydrogenase (NAD+, L-lysine-forming)
MSKVVVLGGAGVVGTACVKMLAMGKVFDSVVIGDINLTSAENIAKSIGDSVSAVQVDCSDPNSIKKVIADADVVINCVGPYYKFEMIILPAVIEMKKHYVDVCDDTQPTYDALAISKQAEDAGITALLGMGSSPGVTNMLAAYAATELLEVCDSIEMFHIHGGEPNEGPGVIGHRFYCMSNPIPVFLDGEAKLVKPEDSASLEEDIEFINLPGKYRVYPYPHPEPITMPMFLKGLKKVTNKGAVLPEAYYNLTRQIHACGLYSKDPVDVKGQKVIPYDFAIAYLIKERDRILKEVNFGEQRGCVKIVVKGLKKGTKEPRTYIFSLVSEGAGKNQALGEATGIPAAFGAMLIHQGKITKRGVLPPEAAVSAMDFIATMQKVMKLDKKSKTKSSPIIFESIDENGNVKRMDF